VEPATALAADWEPRVSCSISPAEISESFADPNGGGNDVLASNAAVSVGMFTANT
jgi:hypothetical protein